MQSKKRTNEILFEGYFLSLIQYGKIYLTYLLLVEREQRKHIHFYFRTSRLEAR